MGREGKGSFLSVCCFRPSAGKGGMGEKGGSTNDEWWVAGSGSDSDSGSGSK